MQWVITKLKDLSMTPAIGAFDFYMKEDGSEPLNFLDEHSAQMYADSIGLVIDNMQTFIYHIPTKTIYIKDDDDNL